MSGDRVKNKHWIAALPFSLASTAALAIPTTFEGTYEVAVNSDDPGLVVTATPSAGDLDFILDVGGATNWITLFHISTDEGTVNSDDRHPVDAAIDFEFTLPEVFGGTSAGQTFGVSKFWGLWQYGVITWQNDGHNALEFGQGGVLDVYLQDATFAHGLAGLSGYSAAVKGRFLYRSASEGNTGGGNTGGGNTGGGSVAVPEPTTLTLLGLGLLVLAFVRRPRTRRTR
jgi:hypothetical protein